MNGTLVTVGKDDFSIAEAALTGQDGAVGADTLRFGVEKAKINWGSFFQDMMRSGRGAASSQFENYSGQGSVGCSPQRQGGEAGHSGDQEVQGRSGPCSRH